MACAWDTVDRPAGGFRLGSRRWEWGLDYKLEVGPSRQGTIDIWGWCILCCGEEQYTVRCLAASPGLYLQDTNNSPPAVMTQNISRHSECILA